MPDTSIDPRPAQKIVWQGTIGTPIVGNVGPITDANPHVLFSPQGTGTAIYITNLVVANTNGVGTLVSISGLTGSATYNLPASGSMGGASLTFFSPLVSSANATVACQCLTSGANVYISANGFWQ